MAAESGNIDGLYNLGIFCYYGWGIERDLTWAARYLAAASALGEGPSEDALQQVLAEIEQEKQDAAAEAAEPVQVDRLPEPAANEAPAQSATAADDGSQDFWRDESRIAAQNPDHYTIQVMALNDLETLKQQIHGFESWAPLAVYTVQKSENPLHVLVQGSYPDVESARAAQKAFPRKIQKRDKLWIRRFGMVQRLLE